MLRKTAADQPPNQGRKKLFAAPKLPRKHRYNNKKAISQKTDGFGPSGESRTHGLLNPIQARYQTALHPDVSLRRRLILYPENSRLSIGFSNFFRRLCLPQNLLRGLQGIDGQLTAVQVAAGHADSADLVVGVGFVIVALGPGAAAAGVQGQVRFPFGGDDAAFHHAHPVQDVEELGHVFQFFFPP